MDHYVKGEGSAPYQGVQTLTQACGGPSGGATGAFDDANTDQPFRAPTWADLPKGEIQYTSGATTKTVAPTFTDQAGQAFDPISGPGACATAPGADQTGAASYRLDPAPAGGFTLMGSPTVIADINSVSPTGQLAARLLDVGPGGTETLVARGLYRPDINTGTEATRQVFQLHPNGWKFEAGHIAKLELIPNDSPYGRVSNGQGPVNVSNLELRLPVLEQPGSLGGLVEAANAKVIPPGYELSGDYVATAYVRPLSARVGRFSLVPAYAACTAPNRQHGPPLAFGSCNPPQQSSGELTIGTPNPTSPPANFSGFVKYRVHTGDVAVQVSIADVRNKISLSDYTGQLQATSVVRITDRHNGPSLSETTQDTPFPITIPCAATAATNIGGTCSVSTTFNAVLPGAVVAGARAVWQLGQVQVFDGGPDDVASTGPNTVFARQGVFVP